MNKTTDLTEGRVTPLVLRFFFPMLVTNMFQQLYNAADTAIVGKGLSDDAVGAVGNMSPLTYLIIGFSMGLSNGFCVLIAQSFGAKDYAKMRRNTASAVKLSVAITIILTVISIIFLKPILVLMQTNEAILKDSLIYGYIIFGGLFSAIAYNMCSGILRALGDSKTPLTAIFVSAVINVLLNCFTIFVMNTGVEGPAAATVIAQAISAVICYNKLRKIEELRLSRSDFAADLSATVTLLKNGIPMALMNSITAVGCIVIQYFVNGLGVAYTSAYSTCSKFVNMFMQPGVTAGFAMSAFTSQNYGAGRYRRIRDGLRVCVAISVIAYIGFGAVMILFPRFLAGTMLSGDEQITLCAQYLPIIGAMLFAVNFIFVFRSGVQGMGKPLIPMLSGILEMIIRVGGIILLINVVGFRATAISETAAWMGAFLMNAAAFIIFLRRKIRTEHT